MRGTKTGSDSESYKTAVRIDLQRAERRKRSISVFFFIDFQEIMKRFIALNFTRRPRESYLVHALFIIVLSMTSTPSEST